MGAKIVEMLPSSIEVLIPIALISKEDGTEEKINLGNREALLKVVGGKSHAISLARSAAARSQAIRMTFGKDICLT